MTTETQHEETTTVEKSTVDNIGEAISVLVQAVHIAQSKGVYSFADSTKVGQALEFIEKAAAPSNVKTEEVDKSSEK